MQRKRLRWSALLMVLVALMMLVVLAGCDDGDGTEASQDSIASSGSGDIILASTTSTQDSGLFDEMLPAFENAYPGYTVKVIAVGTGEALELGRNKDADVLLVHAPASEEEFVAEGYGTERREVMYNDFIIVGPASDPAGISGMEDASAALAQIAEAEADFISRGDDSGTHKKELSLWERAGIEPSGDWYQEVGQGMGEVLRIASESDAYTMVDRATYLALMDTLELDILVEGDDALFNQYGVIPVTDASNPEGAQAFADWITSSEGQDLIAQFGMERFGQPLFIPNAGQETSS
ncbi:MAG TPA: substrate-binding domain-containing protein [Thermoleophilia bacterium]|nr:substrate-binding domain-containing protein [Thermoleophilia bacterium]